MAATLTLPDYLKDIEPVAHLERGRRVIEWTLPGPGQLYRNTFTKAAVEVQEQNLLAPASPLYAYVQRWTGDWSRDQFTPAGRERVRGDVLPYFAEQPGEFDRLWSEKHQGVVDDRGTVTKIDESLEIVAWWERKHRLELMYAAGVLELRPLAEESDGWMPHHRETRQRVPENYRPGSNYPQTAVIAELVHRDRGSLHRGWLCESGDVVPDGGLLR